MDVRGRKQFLWIVCPVLIIGIVGLTAFAQRQSSALSVWTAKIVTAYPHDKAAFTQGLVIQKGQMYEGTGQKGLSTLRKVDFKTGTVEVSVPLDARFFGEGITILDGKVYQLTWQNNIGVIDDLETMRAESTFKYTGEGWGLTHNGKQLILSDGSAFIRFLDPKTFKMVRQIQVRDEKKNRIKSLNELEYINGEIWANIWYEDRVARISPSDGQVLGWIDMSNLFPQATRDREAVLNGIAYDEESKKIYVTGKNWPNLFEIEIQK